MKYCGRDPDDFSETVSEWGKEEYASGEKRLRNEEFPEKEEDNVKAEIPAGKNDLLMPMLYDKNDLHSLMRTCGRFLYLRSGTRAGQGRILAILLNRKSMTQKELLDILGIKPGSLSEILTKLEEKGLIRRRKDEGDRRRCILELTEAGVDAAMFREKKEDGNPAFGVLEEEEQQELKRLLAKLLKDWLGTQDTPGNSV